MNRIRSSDLGTRIRQFVSTNTSRCHGRTARGRFFRTVSTANLNGSLLISKTEHCLHWFTKWCCFRSKFQDSTITSRLNARRFQPGCRRNSLRRHYDLSVLRRQLLVSSSSCTDRNVSHRPTSSPISLTVLTEMPRLIDIVIVEVTKLSFQAITSRTRNDLVWFLKSSFLICAITIHLFLFRSSVFFIIPYQNRRPLGTTWVLCTRDRLLSLFPIVASILQKILNKINTRNSRKHIAKNTIDKKCIRFLVHNPFQIRKYYIHSSNQSLLNFFSSSKRSRKNSS